MRRLVFGAFLSAAALLVACRSERVAAHASHAESDAGAGAASISGVGATLARGPVDTGDAPVRACTGPRKSGTAVICVRAGDASRAPTLRAAVKLAKSGDVIQVAGGTYAEDVVIEDKSLVLAGGFDAAFTKRSLAANETKIQATGSQSAVRITGEGETTQIDGFTITGGGGDPSSAHSGAGIFWSGGSATFSNNRILQNRPKRATIHMTDTRGGGISASGGKGSAVRIVGNVIEGNVSGRGAGIASSGVGVLVIRNNVVRGNRGYSDHGGGLFIDSPNVEITLNLIEGNEIGPTTNPYGYGGGVYLHSVGTVARMSFDIITNNAAVTVGSGVFVDNGAHATLTRELIYGNKCTEAGGAAITIDSTDDAKPVGSVVTIDHSTVTSHDCPSREHGDGILIGGSHSTAAVMDSIFWDNGERQFNFARAAEGPPVVTHSWTDDPSFVDAAQHDYRVRAGSAASGYGVY